MANEDRPPTAAEKGKGKATDDVGKGKDKKAEEPNNKDGKPIANGTKTEESKEGTHVWR